MERTWQQPGTYTGTGEAMKAVGQARLELSGVSTPDHLWPPLSLVPLPPCPPPKQATPKTLNWILVVFHGNKTSSLNIPYPIPPRHAPIFYT